MAEFSSLNGYTVKDTTARNIAKGRNQAVAYSNYGAMVDALNAMDNAEFRTGQNIYIGTVGVPDLWVYTVEPVKNTFSYVSDEKIVELLQNNTTIQVGYYKLAMLEGQKVDLTNVNAAIAENANAISEQNKKIPQLKITEVSGTTDSRGRINTDFDISDKIIVGLLSHHNGDFCLQYRMSANTLGVDFLNSADFSPIANSSRSANVYYMDMPY